MFYRLYFICLLLLSFCLLGYDTVNGQSIDISPDSLQDSIEWSVVSAPVIVHATEVTTPFAITSIDQQDIDQLTAPTIEPLLNATPGIWMQSGALNTNRISIRGVGYREPFATTGIKIYLDEIPLTNGVGESSIEDIHPGILSGINIWRGPSSALWGSGLGGMIHLRSHIPDENVLQTKLQVGSYDRLQFDQHVSLRYGKKQQWGTALHYQYLNDAGYRDNNHYRKNSLTWMQQWRGEKGLTINSFVHAIGLKAFIPSSLNLNDYQNNPSAAAPTWDAVDGNEDYTKWITGLNLIYAPAQGWVYRGSFFGTFFDSEEVRPFNVLYEDNISTGMRHRFTLPVKKAGHVTLGMEYFNEQYAFSTFETLDGGQPGSQLSDDTESRNYLNAFLQTEWTLGTKWYLFAGLNAALSKLSNDDLESNSPIDFFPTAGISYTILSDLLISGSVSRGYSSLALDDVLNSDGMVNPDIVPETGWSEEVSLKYFNDHGAYAKVTFFTMNVRNTVLTRRIRDDLFEKFNGGSSIHSGIEFEYKWISASEKISLDGAYTYSHFRFDEFVQGSTDYSGNQLPGTPDHHLYTRLNLSPWRKWDFHVDYHLVSSVYLDDANSSTADGYQLINAGIACELISGKKWSGSISANLHNLFDVRYSPMFQINAPGTQPRYYYPGKPRSLYLNMVFTHKI
jgi:iron complex outermembrane receptor protein